MSNTKSKSANISNVNSKNLNTFLKNDTIKYDAEFFEIEFTYKKKNLYLCYGIMVKQ